jgi:hypothetical protein
MLWSLIKGAIVLACEVAGVGVIPTAIYVVDTLTTVIAADDPQVEVKNAVKDWAIKTIADRVATGVIRAVV